MPRPFRACGDPGIAARKVLRIINECHEEAKRLVREQRAALDGLIAALLEKETLGEEGILQATHLPPAPQLESRPLLG